MSTTPDGRPRPHLERLVGVPTTVGPPSTPAVDLVGVDPAGAPLTVPVATGSAPVLLVFLSSGCDGCRPFWPAAADPASLGVAEGERVVVVARDPGAEDVAALRRLVVPGSTAVCCSAAWSAYRVQGPPFFALVDPGVGRVVTEGVAWAVPQVAAEVGRARAGVRSVG